MVVRAVVLSLLILAVAAQRYRGNIDIGNKAGAHLIYQETHEKYAFPLVVRDEDVIVRTIGKEIISGVVVSDLLGNGKSFIKDGGVGRRNVKIKLEGESGRGYKFLVQVYAI